MDHNEESIKINNLTIKQPESKKIIKNSTVLLDVNKAPFQDWSAWSVPPRASKSMRGKIRKTALVELTRGCPYKCTYCANVFFNKAFKETNKETGKGQTFYRERLVDNFINEVIYLRDKHGIEYVYIGDETIMTTSQKRFEEIIEKYPRTARKLMEIMVTQEKVFHFGVRQDQRPCRMKELKDFLVLECQQ